ncbi:MAG: hypothetical protein IT460_06525 [Planctomycetes bacterium]|nr:hypothetical protein [Planctomycetota bacterium]
MSIDEALWMGCQGVWGTRGTTGAVATRRAGAAHPFARPIGWAWMPPPSLGCRVLSVACALGSVV